MLALLAVIFLLLVYILSFYRTVGKYPRGPRPWPIIGNLLELPLENMHKYITKMKGEYGPVYTVWQPEPVVYIQDYELAKNALITHGDDYLGRSGKAPDTYNQVIENGGVIFSQGEQWKEDRRVSLHILRDFGMGKNTMEEQVRISIQECIEHIRSMPDKNSVEFRWPIQLYVGNVITRILFGFHYPYNDCERLQKFCDVLNRHIVDPRLNPFVMLAQRLPWIKKLPILGYYADGRHLAIRDTLNKQIVTDVKRTLKGYDVTQEPETFAQAYMQRAKKAGNFSFDRLANVCFDFYIAGSETTSTTFRWGCIFLAQYPEVQEKIRQEVREKIGNRLPSMTDRPNLPYATASVLEMQRCANILPFNVTRRTTVDTVCGDYKIPADTQIQAMIHTVMSSDPHFDDPEVFRPERFLERDGKTFKKELTERIIPFSMGKRICIGEGLARVELFIGVISLIQNFRIKPPMDAPMNLKAIYGGVMLPPANNFVIECL